MRTEFGEDKLSVLHLADGIAITQYASKTWHESVNKEDVYDHISETGHWFTCWRDKRLVQKINRDQVERVEYEWVPFEKENRRSSPI